MIKDFLWLILLSKKLPREANLEKIFLNLASREIVGLYFYIPFPLTNLPSCH